MAEDTKKRNKRMYEWNKENCVLVQLKLNKNTDTDILCAIENATPKATELKRLIRLGIEAEKSQT